MLALDRQYLRITLFKTGHEEWRKGTGPLIARQPEFLKVLNPARKGGHVVV
jgi:hypothetical protein